MSTQVTVNLPDDTYRRAEHLARLTGRDVADILSETIHLSLEPLGTSELSATPVASLSDADVLALADSQMDTGLDWRLRELLAKQRDGELTEGERTSLPALMQVYEEGLLRKAQGLSEAVRRRLRPPLEP
jgi:predicted DNA-binding protein